MRVMYIVNFQSAAVILQDTFPFQWPVEFHEQEPKIDLIFPEVIKYTSRLKIRGHRIRTRSQSSLSDVHFINTEQGERRGRWIRKESFVHLSHNDEFPGSGDGGVSSEGNDDADCEGNPCIYSSVFLTHLTTHCALPPCWILMDQTTSPA